MRAGAAAALGLAAFAGGCALLPDDPFVGRYRVADPKDRATVQILAVSPGRWDMRYDNADPMPGRELVVATRAQLAGWFDDVDDGLRCLATQGRSPHPVICTVPPHRPVRLAGRGAARVHVSATGWILVAPSADGLVAGDLERQP